MKRLFTLFSALALIVNASAQSTATIEDLEIVPGGVGNLIINVELDKSDYFNALQIELILPEGLTTVDDEYGDPICIGGDVFDSRFTYATSHENLYNDNDTFLAYDAEAKGFLVTNLSGTLITIPLKVDAGVAEGTVFNCTVTNLIFAGGNLDEDEILEPIPFNVYVQNHVTLNELSTSLPMAVENTNVTVERTISAQTWSTLVLPFDMTESQIADAFGSDVQIVDFKGYDITEDGESGDIIGITINFEPATTITANTPCLIRVEEPLRSFNVEGVDIAPDEEPIVNFGTKRKPRSMVGTYVANTEVPEMCLFLSGNDFYYSTGLTKMKAFRAYFDFTDVLTSVEEPNAKIRINVLGETTSIEGLESIQTQNGVYNLQGMFIGNNVDMNRQPKGVYIVSGKKFINK